MRYRKIEIYVHRSCSPQKPIDTEEMVYNGTSTMKRTLKATRLWFSQCYGVPIESIKVSFVKEKD